MEAICYSQPIRRIAEVTTDKKYAFFIELQTSQRSYNTLCKSI